LDKQALRPSFYKDFTTKFEEEEVKELDENQQALAYITHFKGWELLKEYKGRLDEYLDNFVAEAMQKGLSAREIGVRTMVQWLTKFVLNSFIDKADAARRVEEK